ncbi:two-component system response regulator [Frondihabitans sp. PAMC 28766]|uniref:response regulator transcription factor n=1 Tax=Frondihabitans sp. PAMC 28766 TaxID=1795630 RepID=UPI00078C6519|nr:response regulator transcription factor [Frondihabitans sp. PAMC 28766]AMM20141.1 two-component system response regulator [Frondihabitans sp. PAMC 28766]
MSLASDAAVAAPPRSVLVVEDDPIVAEVVVSYLRRGGHLAGIATDGLTAVVRVLDERPDLILLDRMLPGIDGLEVCRRIRAVTDVPIIMLTALGEEHDRITGLEAGADDYLVKPFSPRELMLRVDAVLRRTTTPFELQAVVMQGGFRLDASAREITLEGEPLTLTVREFDLLAFLIRHPDRVFRREELLRAVWGWEVGDLSTVTVHVRRLREKVEQDAGAPVCLVTVWGVGYRFVPGASAVS